MPPNKPVAARTKAKDARSEVSRAIRWCGEGMHFSPQSTCRLRPRPGLRQLHGLHRGDLSQRARNWGNRPVPTAADPRVRRSAPISRRVNERLVKAGAREVGLCRSCRNARVVETPRSVFYRCALSEVDPRFPKYPRLPVLSCDGYSPASAGDPATE
jgi:hypothetical protein